MTVHIGLLRAVNLAGRNAVSMSALRELLSDLGMQDVRTALQSGNVVFGSTARSTDHLERLLEESAAKTLRVATDFFVRTAGEWSEMVAANPFADEARRDPGHLLVIVLKGAPAPAAVARLEQAIVGRERMRAEGRQLYVVYPDGVGRSKFTNALIEKHLGTRGTGRNWNTVVKLEAMAKGT